MTSPKLASSSSIVTDSRTMLAATVPSASATMRRLVIVWANLRGLSCAARRACRPRPLLCSAPCMQVAARSRPIARPLRDGPRIEIRDLSRLRRRCDSLVLYVRASFRRALARCRRFRRDDSGAKVQKRADAFARSPISRQFRGQSLTRTGAFQSALMRMTEGSCGRSVLLGRREQAVRVAL